MDYLTNATLDIERMDVNNDSAYLLHLELIEFNLVINQFVKPVIYSVGILSNIVITFLILTSKLGQIASMVYVLGIVIADTGYLLFHVLTWIQFYFHVNTYHAVGLCQLTNYCIKAFTFLSRWYLAGFALERFIWELYPERRAEFCNVFRTKLFLLSLAALATYGHVYLCWFSEVSKDTHYLCSVHLDNMKTFNAMLKIDMILAYMVPTVATIVFGVAILVRKVQFLASQCRTRGYKEGIRPDRKRSQVVDNREDRDKHLHATGILISFLLASLLFTIPLDTTTFLGVLFARLPIPNKWILVLSVMADFYFAIKPIMCLVVSPETRNRLKRAILHFCTTSKSTNGPCPNSNSINLDECTSSAQTHSQSDDNDDII